MAEQKMDAELTEVVELMEFISRLDDYVQETSIHEMWTELENYFDSRCFDIGEYLDELFPQTLPLYAVIECDNVPISEPHAVDIAELLREFSRFKTNDFIFRQQTSFGDKILVTNDSLLDAIKSKNFTYAGRALEHPYETLSFATNAISKPPALSQDNYVTPIPAKTLTSATNSIYKPAEQRRQESNLTRIPVKPFDSSNTAWLSILHGQQLHPGITAEMMAKNILQNKTEILPTQTEIVGLINLLLADLNSYIDQLSVEFADHKFHDESQVDRMARNIQNKILKESSSNTYTNGRVRDVLLKWMDAVTLDAKQINDARRQIEEKASKKLIDRAVDFYRNRLSSINHNEDIAVARKKQRDFVSNGVLQVYSNCDTSFVANVSRELDERLNDADSFKEKPNAPQSFSQECNLLEDLAMSDYNSRISLKGMPSAGISTLQQFDDVNDACRKASIQSLKLKMEQKLIPLDQQKQLESRVNEKLKSSSMIKRNEFERRFCQTVAVSTISGERSSTASRSVGIHFGFETLSVSCYDQTYNNFRSVYGPVPNIISFARNGIFVGVIPSYGNSFNFDKLLTTLDVSNSHYDTMTHGTMKFDSMIALVLMYIDKIVKHTLHIQSSIEYAVAIPSCLSESMQRVFEAAFSIAELNCTLVREQCALTASIIREKHAIMVRHNEELLITLIERNRGGECDSVLYEIDERGPQNRVIKVLRAHGSDSKSGMFGIGKTTGFQSELKNVQDLKHKRCRFLVCCATEKSDVDEEIKKFKDSRVHSIKFESERISNGAALLSFVAFHRTEPLNFSFDIIALSSIKRSPGADVSYRLKHMPYAAPRNVLQISAGLRNIIDHQARKIDEKRADIKSTIINNLKEVDDARYADDVKEKVRQLLLKDLKAIETEALNKLVMDEVSKRWEQTKVVNRLLQIWAR